MRVGILGAGQLARMMALAGIPMGLEFVFYTPIRSDSVKGLGETIKGAYGDVESLKLFLDKVDVLTYENENIPVETIDFINQSGCSAYPSLSGLITMQDRLQEKQFFNQLNIPTNDYYVVNNKADLLQLSDRNLLPLVLKKRRNGYDGKGQVVVKHKDELANIDEEQCSDCIAESFVNFSREVSLIGCRNVHGKILFYDLCENVHKKGVLARTENKPHDPLLEQAKTELTKVMEELDYVGICTLEFFEVNGRLLANELAPRVHNSGHWTIEGSVTSQFENHLRSILKWPLGEVRSYGEFVMHNLLSHIPEKKELIKHQGVKVHDYQKKPLAGRKLGHVTLPKCFSQSFECAL